MTTELLPPPAEHATDREWEQWGARDPYYGVLTDDRFRSAAMTAADHDAFFAMGRDHVAAVLASCRRYFGADFAPRRVLDFGCGVGRVLIPFAEIAESAVGLDISESMLAEARRNCERFGVTNTTLARSDDRLGAIEGTFDLVHTTIVLQHVDSERGLYLISRLVESISPTGVGAIHVTYGRNYGRCEYGRAVPVTPDPPPPPPSLRGRVRAALTHLMRFGVQPYEPAVPTSAAPTDPEMKMYPYDLNRIAYVFQAAGASGFNAEFTDHGGELGVTLFVKPAADRSVPRGFEVARPPAGVELRSIHDYR